MLPKDKADKKQTESTREGNWKGQKIHYRPNRLVIKYKTDKESTESLHGKQEELLKNIPNARVLKPIGATGRVVIAVDKDTDLLKLAEEISKLAIVEYAEPDVVDSAQLVPTDTRYPQQWAHSVMHSEDAWDLQTGSSTKVLIGIIDSGISMNTAGSLDHPDLNQASRYIPGTDFVDGGTPRDLHGHGTHVAGIAAAESNNTQGVCGMNWNTPVYICRTLDATGNGNSTDFADAVEEIVDYAVAHALKVVINYSAGGGANQTKFDACKYANDRGMILCAATGNDSGGPVIFPAAYSTQFDGVIAVGSTDDTDTVSSFSNVGPEVTVVAPGRDILSTMPTYSVSIPATLNYDELSGTSMATPYVTGLVALMWSRHNGFTNTRIRNCLTGSALKLGSGTFNNSWGHGRIRPEQALRCGDILFTRFSYFTRFSEFTFFTPLTRFTLFTPFTRFSALTRFTFFSRFTPFTPFSRFPDFTEDWRTQPFIRFKNMLLAPEDLHIQHFRELANHIDFLQKAGVDRIDILSTLSINELSVAAQITPEDASSLIVTAQQLLRSLVNPQ